MSRRSPELPVVLSSLAVVGLLIGVMPRACGEVLSPSEPEHRDGARAMAHFLLDHEGQALATVILEGSPRRLVTFDARTGERLSSVPACPQNSDTSGRIHPPVGAKVWVSCGTDELTLFDLRTGEALLDTETLRARHPELAAGFQLESPHISYDVDPPARGIAMLLHDGRRAWIDLDGALHFHPVPTDPWKPGYFCWPEATCSTARRECLTFVPAPSGTGMVLGGQALHGERQQGSAPVSDWPVGLLRPGFVKQPDSRCAFEAEDHYLILHDSAAFDPKETLLSWVGRDGMIRWTHRNAALNLVTDHEPRRALRFGREVLVLMTHERHRDHASIVWIDLDTGDLGPYYHLLGPR